MGKDSQHDVYLALGTNLGNKGENIMQALKYIEERVGAVVAHSSFYMTRPVGFDSPNEFVNAACLVLTPLSPSELLIITQQIEKEMGRTMKSVDHQYADRIIDIDILTYDDLILEDENLIIPHPHMHERSFVLDPLVEIAGFYHHPVFNKDLYTLKEELDKSKN